MKASHGRSRACHAPEGLAPLKQLAGALFLGALLAGCQSLPEVDGPDHVVDRFHDQHPGAELQAACTGDALRVEVTPPGVPHPFVDHYAVYLTHDGALLASWEAEEPFEVEVELLEACAPFCTFTLHALDGEGRPSDPLLARGVLVDADGDGFVAMACGGDDCDDDDPYTYPGAPELCDGADNSCSGVVDDVDLADAPYATNQEGVCFGSRKVCKGGGWQEPDEDFLRAHSDDYDPIEDCNGLDNSCTGVVDDVDPADAPDAANQQGVCLGSKQVCEGGGWRQPTVDELYAHSEGRYNPEEQCDGFDNSCSGVVDDIDLTDAPFAENQQGVCLGARQVCDGDGGWRQPEPDDLLLQIPDYHPIEDCNGLDNSCTGEVDDVHEDDAPDATNQKGVCEGSLKVCENGAWREPNHVELAEHSEDYEPIETQCDELDNDCSGEVDLIYTVDPESARVGCWGYQWRYTPEQIHPGPLEQVAVSAVWGDHACAIDSEGRLFCWGDNSDGQLGDGTWQSRKQPAEVAGGGSWLAVSPGGFETCGIRADHSLWCWGWPHGNVPQVVEPGETWVSVSLGAEHICAIKTDDSLWCWGYNDYGQVGAVPGEVGWEVPEPRQVEGQFLAVEASSRHTCALDIDKVLTCWGFNGDGQVGTDPSWDPVGIHEVPPPEDRAWAGVWTSIHHTCALDSEGAAWCWGGGWDGQLGNGESGASGEPHEAHPGPFVHIAVSAWSNCARTEDGEQWCWGYNDGVFGDGTWDMAWTPTLVDTGPWSSLSLGNETGCGLHASDGSLWCWGDPQGWATAYDFVNPQWAGDIAVSDLAVSGSHGCLVRFPDGQVLCWGSNDSGHLGTGTTEPSATAVPIDLEGRVFTQVSVREYASCALDDEGYRWCWGAGNYLGQGLDAGGSPITTDHHSPWQDPEQTWIHLDFGSRHACAVDTDQKIWCWGHNEYQQCGVSGGDVFGQHPRYKPVQPNDTDEEDWQAVAAGGTHSCGLRDDDTLWCWGRNNDGQLGRGSTFDAVRMADDEPGTWKSVAAGGAFTCAIALDDTLWCWGANNLGQLGDGTLEGSTTPVKVVGTWSQVVAGYRHACAVSTDGSSWCWGHNAWSALGLEPGGAPSEVYASPVLKRTLGWSPVAAGSDRACVVEQGFEMLPCAEAD